MSTSETTPPATSATSTTTTTTITTPPLPPPSPPLPNPDPTPILTLSTTIIRRYLPADAASMQRHADNLKIARWMRNTFPSPYKLSHSAEWIAITAAESPTRKFAIATLPTAADPHGAFIGSIGLMPKADIEQHCMEVGYWVAEPHWGGGIMTEVVRAFTRWAFETNPELLRIDGSCFEGNEGSAKVLTKGGFTYEGMRRNAVYKNGEVMGLKLFGLLREECEGLSTVQAVAAKE